MMVNHEEFLLKVKNKEINRERQKRKDDYQKELYQQKFKKDDQKYVVLKEIKQKEIDEKQRSQVLIEMEKHQMQEAIYELYVKNQFDASLLEDKVRQIENQH